ncbi:MAG: NAD(P)/FAD-dependent oxidoreductase [Bacillota bacterium]
MWLKITQFKTGLDAEEAEIKGLLAEHLKLPAGKVKNLKVLHKSLDARRKEALFFVYTLLFEGDFSEYELEAVLKKNPNLSISQPGLPFILKKQSLNIKHSNRPVIVGAGPAGLFAGLKLAASGFRPIIIERGEGLKERIEKVNRFWRQGLLDPNSNIQYGIGGAGTFSDGKLMTRVKDPALPEILQIIVKLGGPPEIMYWQYPHIGTDLLRHVVTNLENLIINYGGELRFQSRMTDIQLENGCLKSLLVNDEYPLETALLLLAVGNSARDTYELLKRKGIQIIPKPFAVGLRIEHPQDLINKAQYGRWADHPKLGPAEYRLTYQHRDTGRGVYTFCMCPGGLVIGATSEFNSVVTNGMSYQARNSGIANAAIIVTVNQEDFGDNSALAGIAFQRQLEQKAFVLGGSTYAAPAQKVNDFLNRRPSADFNNLKPTYLPGYLGANLWDLLPLSICTALKDGIKYFGRQLKGFDWPDAVLTGVETRTSAPVRILRNESREATGFKGIYPIGEGAGYAGGIISSALDGWKTAELILTQYS